MLCIAVAETVVFPPPLELMVPGKYVETTEVAGPEVLEVSTKSLIAKTVVDMQHA